MRILRTALRRLGVDIVRFPPRGPLYHFLRHYDIATVVDVGANVGQYGEWLRRVQGYRGRIVSFEPNPSPFATLERVAAADGGWTCLNVGLGSECGELPLNVADGDDVISSVLPMTDRFRAIHPIAFTERVVRVPVLTLAEAARRGAFSLSDGNTLLKIDTQGFERPVLSGAGDLLERFAGIQIELSLQPCYQGQPRMEEMVTELRTRGFTPYAMWSGYQDRETLAQLELDGVFVRDGI